MIDFYNSCFPARWIETSYAATYRRMSCHVIVTIGRDIDFSKGLSPTRRVVEVRRFPCAATGNTAMISFGGFNIRFVCFNVK